MAIPEVSVLPSFHDQLSAGLRSIGRNPGSTQASEMVLRETRVDNVKCLLTTFNPFADEGQQYTVLLIRRMEEGTNVALSTKRRVGKMDRLFGSRHLISVEIRLYQGGQYQTMQSSFFRLGVGIAFAVILVYLLMSVNFQSWLDPFIILTALPGALAGILWMLFVTGTTLSVPSLMGAIMCIGVATANSILMVTFANDERSTVPSARDAMLSAGHARIRPVLMTATAMILGMLPMSLGWGEGGEQNAPLARAVIGGLMFATVTTLFVVPIIYSYLRKKPPVDYERQLVEQRREGFGDSEWNLPRL